MALFNRKKHPADDGAAGSEGRVPERAPDLFKHILATRWAPALRELGFKGSGRTFVLPDEHDWVMLSFQSSRASNAECVKFTLNLLVVGKQTWEDARVHSSSLSAKPSPNAIGPHRYMQRIGHLTHGGDHWWRLYASSDAEPLIAEISAVLREVAVPKLRMEMADQRPGPRGTFENVKRERT